MRCPNCGDDRWTMMDDISVLPDKYHPMICVKCGYRWKKYYHTIRYPYEREFLEKMERINKRRVADEMSEMRM